MAKFLISAFLSVCLTAQICLGLLGNWCEYEKEESSNKLARSCANDRFCRRFLGFGSTESNTYKDCCPGYTNKHLGCLTKTCIVLPQDALPRLMCPAKRALGLTEQRLFYKLTTPPEEPLAYPNQTSNLFEAVPFPLLDQSSEEVVLRSIGNPDETGWVIRYLGLAQRNQKLAEEELPPFTKYADYAQLLESYRLKQAEPLINIDIPFVEKDFGIISMEEYMRYPTQQTPFKDIIEDESWQKDDVFVQQRLAGLNPMALRKMTNEDYNQDHVNKEYDWNAAMKRATGEEFSFSEMLEAGKVYIVDYKELHEVTTVEDLTDLNTTDRREMRQSRSPFCVLVSAKGARGNELKAVAIQKDLKSDAPVFSPIDGAKWMMAKEEIQRADITYAELVEHLLKTHLLMEPICVCMRRTISSLHPLNQLLKWSCRGMFVTNSLGLKALLLPEEFLHKLFTIGHIGAVEVLNKAYPDMSWAVTEFDKNLQRRGVDNQEELPYFPYRDDGSLIWKEVGDFSKEYVDLYYTNDELVVTDKELANFANELSLDGTGDHGGIGMFKGFPNKINTKSELIDVIKRIVFIPMQHSAVNYPVAYYGAFVPNLPTKLYNDPRVPPQEFGVYSLPQSHVATEQVSLSMSLGSIRYDVIFDYGKHMVDDRARAVVEKYHKKLVGEVEDIIEKRNTERLAEGKLSYPYLLPKWIPNSIHT